MVFRFISLVIIVLSVISPSFALQQDNKDKYIEQFKEVFSIVEKKYVEQPDKQKMIDGAIRGMLKSLDPYSTLFVDEDLEDFKKEFDGEFGGIGVEIYPDKTGLKIISPIDDLPAFKAGIKAGDVIVGVDDYDVTNEFYDKALKKIRGPIGTKVKITIYRAGEKDLLEFELVREIVKINQVKSEIDGDIGYIRISTFNKNTFNSFIDSIEKLKKESKKPLKGIILDLRNNPGGLLDQAIKISSYFVNNGAIVKIKGRKASQNYDFMAEPLQQKFPNNLYVIVLINGGSASASEIVAGALQDHKKAIILGTKSFGKGSVQEFIEINKRSAVKLTEASFYSPNGNEIQENGIIPDIIIENQEISYKKQEETIVQKFFSNSRKQRKNSAILDKKIENSQNETKIKKEFNKEKKENIDSRSDRYLKDYQYSRAFDLIQGLNIANPIQSK